MCKSNVSFPPMPIDCKPSKDAIVNCSAFIRGEENRRSPTHFAL